MKFDVNLTVNTVTFGNELALLNIESGEYFVINEVGSIIFGYLKKMMTIEEIITQLLNHYNIEYDVCKSEVEDFIARLEADKIIFRRD